MRFANGQTAYTTSVDGLLQAKCRVMLDDGCGLVCVLIDNALHYVPRERLRHG